MLLRDKFASVLAVTSSFITFSICNDSILQDFKDDVRYIPYKDFKNDSEFTDTGVNSFGVMLFAKGKLFVGAMDHIYSLHLENLTKIQKIAWVPSDSVINECMSYGKSKEDCHNYVNVLLSHGERIFICGTYAYDAKCSLRKLDQLDTEDQSIRGSSKCAHNPRANITFLLTSSGQYFLGSTIDFNGIDATISRFSSLDDRGKLTRTIQYSARFLNEPQFVGSFEDDKFVYFVFREISLEYARFGKRIYSRIARVCKNETIYSPYWNAFTKARLSCAVEDEDTFYYNEVQGMHFDTEKRVLYATFTTPRNSIAGSSICAYNMSAIEEVFLGRFISQSQTSSDWVSQDLILLDQCQPREDNFPFNFLEAEIKPTGAGPLHTAVLERYTHIAITTSSTFSSSHLIFVATDAGLIKKISLSPLHVTCVTEIWQPFLDSNVLPIHTMKYLNDTKSLYIGTDKSVVKIAIARCHRYTSKESCVNDPLCDWNGKCDQIKLNKNDQRSFKDCPVSNAPIDGGWSEWSSKSNCYQINEISSNNNSKIDSAHSVCQCQLRKCNKPVPRNGGKACEGSAINVVYCNVHDDWSPWSIWSWSASCGDVTKYRTRTCKKINGNPCEGVDRQMVNDPESPQCPTPASLLPTFSEWSACSSDCGIATRSRAKCDSPPCLQCDLETEFCQTQQCKLPPLESNVTDRWSSWSDWSACSGSCGDEISRRHRQCIVPSACKGDSVDEKKCPYKSDGVNRGLLVVMSLLLGIVIGLAPFIFIKYQIYKKAPPAQPPSNSGSLLSTYVVVPLKEVK